MAMFDAIPNYLKGILLALVSTGLFVVVGVLVRMLSSTIDTFQILLFRQVVFLAILMPAIKANIPVLLKPKKVKLHLLRITGAFFALYLGFVTVSNIPLADAKAIGFLQVLFVALISRMCLSEAVSASRWFTILVGFLGVMLIVQPNFADASFFYIVLGALGALGAATAVVCVRKVAQTEPRITLLAYQAIFVGLLALIPSLYSWQWPTFNELCLLILVGAISSVAQWFGVSAYKWGEANVIANVEYISILYSIALGYLLFAEIPNSIAFLGAAVLISSVAIPYLYKAIRPNARADN
ncbi:EamA/RhaT family transporter [Photobacterium sanctipauli]|uniref:EamA/RhaT family transporter n=2 Tax=Photobacterium sanctipauli TaxID=1342794 RepID=A0A2T3NPC7_9GAMM|nr:EamA/RhaT family transporter [Photobacterium sanctipauli]